MALFAVFAPGLAQQALTAARAGPEWRHTLREFADPAPGESSVWVAGAAASWPQRRGNLTALLDRLSPHLDDKTVLAHARTPELAGVYAQWGWTPEVGAGQTLIRRGA